MVKVIELIGYICRVFYMVMSLDGQIVVFVVVDEIFRIWKCFVFDFVIKKLKIKSYIDINNYWSDVKEGKKLLFL